MAHKIAFVDDESSILESLRWIFKDEPYEDYTFQNPLKALDEIKIKNFAVVVADQMMPDMDGSVLLKKIQERHPSTECIIMSAKDNCHNLTGVTERIIVKPWDIELLKTYIRNAVNRYEQKCAASDQSGSKEKRILFIDDNPYVVDCIQSMMEYLGYQVVISTKGSQAIRLVKSLPDNFDIVITDMNMPNMNGLELSKEILSICPHMPIILYTGQGTSGIREKIQDTGITSILQKPFSINEMDDAIRKLLN